MAASSGMARRNGLADDERTGGWSALAPGRGLGPPSPIVKRLHVARVRREQRSALLVLALIAVLAGCSAGGPTPIDVETISGPAAAVGTAAPPSAATAGSTPTSPPASASPVSSAAPTSKAGPVATVTPSGASRAQVRLPGEPNPALTPGAANPAVTQATIGSTICVSGWTATIRPPSSYTTGIKRPQILAYGYADRNLADYEEDHLISLEIGGAPRDAANLWPEPYTIRLSDGTPVGARVKDQLENTLKRLVCARSMTLATAQRLIATDWIAAWRTYVKGGPIPPPVPLPAPVPAATPPLPAPTPGGSAIRVVITSLTSPIGRGSTATVTATTTAGAACSVVVVYKSGPSKASGLDPATAGPDGAVAWSWTVGSRTTIGSWPVTVTCTIGDTAASATRSMVVQ